MLWLYGLLSASFSVRTMQQSDVWVGLLYDLALDFQNEAQNAVRRRMLRPEIHCVALNLSHRSHP